MLCSRNCSTNRENASSVSLGPTRARGCAQRKQIHVYWCDGECLETRLREYFIPLVFSAWVSLDSECYSGMESWKSSNGLKMLLQRTWAVFSLRAAQTYFCANSSIISTVQKGQRFLFLANLCHGDGLCLLKPVFTLCSLGQLGKQKRQHFREEEIPGNAKSVVLYCLHKADVLLAPNKGHHHFGVMGNLFCWAPAAVKESSSSQGHRYTINSLFTKTKCSRLAVLQSLVIKVIYLYEAFRLSKAFQVNNRIKE